NAVRDRLKARGYRVLIIQDPNRALARFADAEEQPADCVIFGASELGADAVDAYNQFSQDELTAGIPSILLVDRRQTHLIQAARRGPNRIMLGLPLKVRELRQALKQLLVGVNRRPMGTY
ncbi:MAG: serine/threonine protein kinase, partial [Novipirellula sp. JB048]